MSYYEGYGHDVVFVEKEFLMGIYHFDRDVPHKVCHTRCLSAHFCRNLRATLGL